MENLNRQAGSNLIPVIMAPLVILCVFVFLGFRAREMEAERQKAKTLQDGFSQGLGHPAPLTNLNAFPTSPSSVATKGIMAMCMWSP